MNNRKILTIQQIIESEKKFIAKFSEETILNVAGKKIAEYLKKYYADKKIFFVCGHGNNGNDGKKCSFFLKGFGIESKIFLIDKQAKQISKKIMDILQDSEIIVDCIFGIGVNRIVDNFYKEIINSLNFSKKKIISIDIPSGVCANTGKIFGTAIKADITLAMGFYKPAHFLLPSKSNCGKVKLLNLKLPSPKKRSPEINLISNKYTKKIPTFDLGINKYDRGHVIVIGGEMPGASRIVALTSRKVGAGLSTIAISKKFLSLYAGTEPGTILSLYKEDVLNKKNVLVIGPGLGKNFSIESIEKIIIKFSGPVVLDADGISNFKNHKEKFFNLLSKKKKIIITPHHGEFKRIFTYDNDKINNCLNAAKKISNCVLLKGSDTVISFPNGETWINNCKSNSLATAGTGDLLCGLIAGLIAQKMDFKDAILLSILIQNKLSTFKNCQTVEDFINYIPKALRAFKKNN